MAWNAANETIPVRRDKVSDAIDEIVAAINERRTAIIAIGWTDPLGAATSGLSLPATLESYKSKINELRDDIESLAPYFCDPDQSYRPFNATTRFDHPDGSVNLWAATFGKEKDSNGDDTATDRSNWMNVSWRVTGFATRPTYASNVADGYPYMEWHYITELRDTLNEMVWLVHRTKRWGEPHKDAGSGTQATRAAARTAMETAAGAATAAHSALWAAADDPPAWGGISGGTEFAYEYDDPDYFCDVSATADKLGWHRGFAEFYTADHNVADAVLAGSVTNWMYDSVGGVKTSVAPGGDSWTPQFRITTTSFGDPGFYNDPDDNWNDGTDIWDGGSVAGTDHHSEASPEESTYDLSHATIPQNDVVYCVLHGCDYDNDKADAFDNIETKDWDVGGALYAGAKRISLDRILLKYDFDYR